MTDIRAALVDQLQRSAEGEAWHGPSLREALGDVNIGDAERHPIAGAHSIRELVGHLAATYRLVLRRIDGDSAPLSPEEDWPVAGGATEDDWRREVDRLFGLNAQARAAIGRFPPERLFEPLVANPAYSAFTQFIGLTQHDLYHAGQIVLLKRALDRRDTTP